MQGQDFATNPGFINALEDFNAFEQNTAFKNVFRILIIDGYVGKLLGIGTWDLKAQSIANEIVTLYGVDRSICTYLMESLAYGLGLINNPPVFCPSKNNSSNPKPSKPKPTSLNKSHKDFSTMNEDDISLYIRDAQDYLDSIIEIKGNWEEELGAKFKIYSYYVVSTNGWHCIKYRIEVNGKIKIPKSSYVEFVVVLYDEFDRIIGQNHGTYWIKQANQFEVVETMSIDHTNYRSVSNIAKSILYWKHD